MSHTHRLRMIPVLRQPLSRRHALRGLGVLVTLPLLSQSRSLFFPSVSAARILSP